MNAKKKILIVDDDPDLINLVSVWLGKDGYETEIARDALTCVAAARKDPPSAILLDLGLPAGGGLVALERLKRMEGTSMVPVIVLTSRNTATARASAETGGAFAFLAKEGTKDALLAAVCRACETQEASDSF
ncbi:MAG: PleD family two-component system response regulator [Myxococcota bacterium]